MSAAQVTTGDVSLGTAVYPIPSQALVPGETAPTILVVESDPRQRVSVLDILRSAGYQIAGVDSFHEAQLFLGSIQPDLLIADIQLGAFNGLQLVRQRHAAHPAQPSIVTHAVADAVLQHHAFTLQAPYLVKPIRTQALLSAVEALVPRPRPASPVRHGSRRGWGAVSTVAADLATGLG